VPHADGTALRTRLIWIKAPTGRKPHTAPIAAREALIMSTPNSATLYDRIGGAPAVEQMVERFYTRVLGDDSLRPYFDRVAMDKLRRMQSEFFAAALDGPIRYSGRPVIHAHQGHGITREAFQAFVEHLFETLRDYNLDDEERYAVIARINTYADDVINYGVGIDN
jgi:hemoglobin